MKCRNCGSNINDGDVFCPVCSALAPTKHSSRLSKLFTKLNRHADNNSSIAILCLCEILLSALFILTCFAKCFAIAGEQVIIKLSLYDSFIGNSRFNFVLIIILNILADAVLLIFIKKKTESLRVMLFIPAATYVWSIVQFIIKTVNVSSNIITTSNSTVQFSLTPIGWIHPFVCAASIAILIMIAFKLNNRRS